MKQALRILLLVLPQLFLIGSKINYVSAAPEVQYKHQHLSFSTIDQHNLILLEEIVIDSELEMESDKGVAIVPSFELYQFVGDNFAKQINAIPLDFNYYLPCPKLYLLYKDMKIPS